MASFFKVLTLEYLHNVFIPRAFMTWLSGKEMKIATLTSSKGRGNQSWSIRLKKDDEGLYYFERKGWIKFMNDHDLKIGEVLLFEHNGGLKFHVLIFDKSYCEKTKLPISLPTQIKEERNIVVDEALQIKKEEEEEKERIEDEDEYVELPQLRSSQNAKHPKRNQSAVEAANKTHSPHFMATIYASNLNYQTPYFNIPSTFVSQIGEANCMGNVITIRDSDQGMIWSVEYQYRRGYSGTNAGKRMFLRTGWNDFSVSKNLKVGDTCIFKLDTEARKNGIIILDVQIFRG